MFAYTRTYDISSFQYLTAQTRHALREDKTSKSRMREDATPGTALHMIPDAPAPDYVKSFKNFKSEKGAAERKSAKIGLHIICGVSTDWMTETGDLHDPENPRQRELLDSAIAWANSWSDDGVFDARIDLDETGGAVVDLFVAPTAIQNHKSGKSKKTISVNKALEALSIEMGLSKSKHLSALNSSWAKYAQANLDSRLVRGTPKSETKKEHIPPDQYRQMMERATKAEADAEALRKRAVELEASTQKMVDTAVEDAVRDAKEDIEKLKAETVELKNSMEAKIEAAVQNAVHISVGLITGIFTNETRLNPEKTEWLVSDRISKAPRIIAIFNACLPAIKAISKFWRDANDRMPQENAQEIMLSAEKLKAIVLGTKLDFQNEDPDQEQEDDSPSPFDS